MLQIIFDSDIIKTSCASSFDNVTIKTEYSDAKSGFIFDKAKNTMIINYDVNSEINKNIFDIISEREKIFLENLCKEKNFSNCWVTFLDGKIQQFVDGKFEFNNNFKKSPSQKLSLLFNDNLKIIFSNKEIGLEEFKKTCQNKFFNFELNLRFYAIIYTTKNNINIKIKLKVPEIKILQLKDITLNLFRVKDFDKNTDSYMYKNNYEYIPKYPTNKKKVIENILQLIKKE
jgi:hypothetical protein